MAIFNCYVSSVMNHVTGLFWPKKKRGKFECCQNIARGNPSHPTGRHSCLPSQSCLPLDLVTAGFKSILWLFCGFSMVLLGFSMVLLGFSMVLLGVSMVLLGFSMVLLGFSMVLLGFSDLWTGSLKTKHPIPSWFPHGQLPPEFPPSCALHRARWSKGTTTPGGILFDPSAAFRWHPFFTEMYHQNWINHLDVINNHGDL